MTVAVYVMECRSTSIRVIAEIVARTGGFVSIKETIAQVRGVISTSRSDADLQSEIATAAAYQGKPILFDRG